MLSSSIRQSLARYVQSARNIQATWRVRETAIAVLLGLDDRRLRSTSFTQIENEASAFDVDFPTVCFAFRFRIHACRVSVSGRFVSIDSEMQLVAVANLETPLGTIPAAQLRLPDVSLD